MTPYSFRNRFHFPKVYYLPGSPQHVETKAITHLLRELCNQFKETIKTETLNLQEQNQYRGKLLKLTI